jgi:hypothetical protein
MSNGALPTFILIGAMKCGTTSLYHYLGAHPQICVSDPKEPDFFLRRNEKGLAWYKQCFQGSAQAYGEASTNYTKYPAFQGVPERMHRALPDLKLLYLVRDPIERAVSHYAHNRVDGRESQSIDEAFRPVEDSHYLQTSRYHFQLSQYLEHYSEEDVLVIESEQLRADRMQVLREIFAFLGVAQTVEGSAFEEEYHTTSGKLKPGVSTFLQETQFGQFLTSVGKALLPDVLLERGLEAFRTDIERPTLSESTRERMRAYLQPDVAQLRRLTGKDFASWSL